MTDDIASVLRRGGCDLRSAVHIWTSRMLPGIVLPEGAVQFSGEPR